MDATYLQRFLSASARSAKRSEIRELLKLIARPEVISLAGGLPCPSTFPVEELADMMPDLLREHGSKGLQYGSTEGDPALRKELIAFMATDGIVGLTPDHVLVTTASQQGLDLCARAFIAPGDAVVCGLPSYLGALSAFTACGARLSGIPLDDDGMRMDLLEQRLVDLRRQGVRPKFVYVVPDFQNPAGVTLSLGRRLELLEIARDFDLLVVEDSPYRQLRYAGDPVPSLHALDRDDRVISLFTFSKILFPGLRLGWIVAHPDVVASLVVTKQPLDLCTSPFTQLVAREYLRSGLLPGQIERTKQSYAQKRRAFLAALEEHIDPQWDIHWTRPEGGLFLWMTLPRGLRSTDLLEHALKRDVAFVTGPAFHCDGSGQNALRLNFSYPPLEMLQEGAHRLAKAIGAMMDDVTARTQAEAPTPMRTLSTVADGDHILSHLPWNLALTEVVE
jgi:2-aminoadipate transaminase